MGQRRRPKSRNQRCRRGEILGKIQDSGEKKIQIFKPKRDGTSSRPRSDYLGWAAARNSEQLLTR